MRAPSFPALRTLLLAGALAAAACGREACTTIRLAEEVRAFLSLRPAARGDRGG
ncbi:hypothetical protein [Sorangium sp. So ce1153]|uniref:hypothetical protein n=1 Tax=Sorangium sp. So ce1153 TaxID=3133333 RepID=UPI003F63D449